MSLRAVLAVVIAALAGPPTVADPAQPLACRITKRVVIVHLDHRQDRGTLRHVWAAVAAGEPGLLHIRRSEAKANRRASLRGIPPWGELSKAQRQRLDPDHWDVMHDRDEYPPAMADEGGRGADVRYVLSSDNRSAGQAMGAQLAPFCDEQKFRFERKPGPRLQSGES